LAIGDGVKTRRPLRIAEGYGFGNFKPSADTVAALHRVLLAAGVAPTGQSAPPASENREIYREKRK
jgi:hypothetical protein